MNPINKGNIPLHTLHLDHIGLLPSTHKDHKHIFTVVDALIKYTWIFSTKSTGAAEVINKMHLLEHYSGNASQIIADKGSAFRSNDFKENCEGQKMHLHLITTGCPRENGQVERINVIIEITLRR